MKNPIFINQNKGFTMIEVISVLVIIGIISAVAAVEYTNTDADLISQINVIKSHLRYAQSRAMASENVWGIESNGASYFMFRRDEANNDIKVSLPGESSKKIILNDKGVDSMDSFIVAFDEMGWPSKGQSINVGSKSNAIEITAVTGYIP